VLIENEFKAELPVLANAMVVGDKRKFLAILLCLKTVMGEDGLPTTKLCDEVVEVGKSFGSNATTVEEVKSDPLWDAYLTEGMKRANAKAISNAQRVQKYAILTNDFTEKGGELTPTLKLKRSVTMQKYADLIDSLYSA